MSVQQVHRERLLLDHFTGIRVLLRVAPGPERRRDLNQFCALNAVYNALLVQSVLLPESVYHDIYSRGALFSLESVVGLIHGAICQFAKPKGVNHSGLSDGSNNKSKVYMSANTVAVSPDTV